MNNSKGSISLFIPLLVAICVLTAIASLVLFGYITSADYKSNMEKAELEKESKALKDRLALFEKNFKKNTDTAASWEAEKRNISDRENETSRKLEALMKDNVKLKKDVDAFNKHTPAQIIKLLAAREANENAIRLLNDTADNLDMIREGKKVVVEPVALAVNGNRPRSAAGQKQGKILSVDARENLVILDLGKVDNVKEGQPCTIYDGGDVVGTAFVAWVRITISAVIVKYFQPNYSFKDLKEGLRVSTE